MLIPLGIIASSGKRAGGSYELIQTVAFSTNQFNATFTNLSQLASSYKHLQIRYTARANGLVDSRRISMTFNYDFGNNYSAHALSGNGSSVTSLAEATSGQISMNQGEIPGGNMPANIFGSGVYNILDAFSTTKNKTVMLMSGWHAPSVSRISLTSGHWRSTTPIDIINMNGDFAPGSRVSLYGLKAS